MVKSESEMLLKRASNCKSEELKDLLKQVEAAIKKSKEANKDIILAKTDKDLLIAKTIITTKLVSKGN